MCRPSPQQLASTGSEDGHQTALFAEIANLVNSGQLPKEANLAYAIPNGGARGDSERSNKIRGAKLKATGVKKGVPDIKLPVARRGYFGLYIEMKRPKSERGQAGRVSEEQEEWHVALREQGYCVLTCIGYEPALNVLKNYLAGEKTKIVKEGA